MQNQRPIVAYIIFENHPTLKDKIPLFQGQNIIGRVPEKASVIIKDAQISSCHAKIKITPKTITIVDMGSKNGTFLDVDIRERIEKGKQYEIIESQILSFGQVDFFIERVPQQKKGNGSPKNAKEAPQKKHNILAEFDQLTQKESKKAKINQKDRIDSSVDSSVVDKKPKKGSQKGLKGKKETPKVEQAQEDSEIESQIEVPLKNSKEIDDKKSKLAKQKEQKDKKEKEKEKKQKELKQKKLREQKEKKEKEEQLKRQREQLQRREQQQRERKEKEQKEQHERKRKQQKARVEKQLKKKEEQQNKKKKIDDKKDNIKKTSKNDENNLNPKNIKGRNSKSVSNQKNDKKNEKPKSKQKAQNSQATSRNSSFSPQKKNQLGKNQIKKKQDKDAKKGKLSREFKNEDKQKIEGKKGTKASLKVQMRPQKKSDSNSKQKSNRSSGSNEKDQKQKALIKTKNRKKVPVSDETDEKDDAKGYRLRQKLLKVTKFKISGNPITFHTSPFLKLVEQDDEDFDVLVMDSFIRTFKLLFAISKGIPVVKKSWLAESEYNKKVAQVDFHWLEYPGDKWLIKNSVVKVQEGDLVFKDMEFHIASSNENLHIEYKKLERLIYNGGGSVIIFSAKMKADKNYAKKVLVLLERDHDEDELKKAKSVNKESIYDVELVLEATLTQELDLSKHKLDL